MTTATKSKRLDAVEVGLTPKEWAIRLADKMRSVPTEADFYVAIAKGTFEESPHIRPYKALAEQAKQRHPGKAPDDHRAMVRANRSLRMEYHALKRLIVSANDHVKTAGNIAGLKAALKLARLETIVLQDAFGRTARKAAEWIEEYKTADEEEEANRQGMLSELSAYSGIDFGEKWSDSVPLPGGIRMRFPSVIEDWIVEVSALANEVYSHRYAVQIIQDDHFDGHPILFRDVEAALDAAIQTLEDGVETFNSYLKTRAEIFRMEWDADEEENDGVATAIPGEREGRLAIDIEAIRASAKKYAARHDAAKWTKAAKDSAKADILEETEEGGDAFFWQAFRDQVKTEIKP